jgi:hypothetical protein
VSTKGVDAGLQATTDSALMQTIAKAMLKNLMGYDGTACAGTDIMSLALLLTPPVSKLLDSPIFSCWTALSVINRQASQGMSRAHENDFEG